MHIIMLQLPMQQVKLPLIYKSMLRILMFIMGLRLSVTTVRQGIFEGY